MEEKDTKEVEKNKIIKINFFQKIWISITKIELYPLIVAEGLKKALMYLSGLVLLLVIVFSSGIIYDIVGAIDDVKLYLENEFPDISYNNGKLDIKSEQPIYLEDKNLILGKAIIDTKDISEEQEKVYIQEAKNDNINGIIILDDKVIINNITLKDPIIYTYTDIFTGLQIETFNKQNILDYINSSQIIWMYITIFLILCIYSFVIYFIINIINIFFLSIVGYFTTMLARIRIKHGAIFNMAVYATTLSIFLNVIYIGVNIFIDFNIEYFQVMYTTVASIYLIASIFMFKSDFIKQQMELMKIMEVQEQVKKDIELQEKNEKEKDKDKNKEKETDNRLKEEVEGNGA